MEGAERSEAGSLVAGSDVSGLGRKYGSESKSCWVELKTKGKMALLGPRSLLDKSCL